MDDIQCDFGKWLTEVGEDPEISAFPCYSEIVDILHDMHEELKRVADAVRSAGRPLVQSDLTGLRVYFHQMDTCMFERERQREAMAGKADELV